MRRVILGATIAEIAVLGGVSLMVMDLQTDGHTDRWTDHLVHLVEMRGGI